MELVVALRSGEILGNSPRAASLLQVESTALHLHIAMLSPILSPTVPYNPVETLFGISTPTHNRDDVVSVGTHFCSNACCVSAERICIDAASNRAAGEDLLLHRIPR